MKYLNYATTYAYQLRIPDKEVFKLRECRMKKSACFSDLFYGLSQAPKTKKTKFNIILKICHSDRVLKQNADNQLVVMPLEDIVFWLNYIKKIISYTYTISDKKDEYRIQLKGQLPPIEIKILTSLVRYIYEAPYSLVLAEAIQLYKLRVFGRENLFNIYSIMSFTSMPLGTGHGHIFTSAVYDLVSLKKLKEEMKKTLQVNHWIPKSFLKSDIRLKEGYSLLREEELRNEYDGTDSLDEMKRIVNPIDTMRRYNDTYKYVYKWMKVPPMKEEELKEAFKRILEERKRKA